MYDIQLLNKSAYIFMIFNYSINQKMCLIYRKEELYNQIK